MKNLLLLFIIFLSLQGGQAFSQNVGIGTISPGSKLSVNGSIAGGYTSVTANTYTISQNDYYIIWNQTTVPGSGVGTFTLPAAAATNLGRVYKIKNNSSVYPLTINNSGSVLIDYSYSVNIPPRYSMEIIANGNTTVSTTCWEIINLVPITTSDAIRNALALAGCPSCAAYDAAPADTWLQINNAEYNSILANLSGVGAYMSSSAQMSMNTTSGWSGGYTVTQATVPDNTQIPPANYPVALAVRSGGPASNFGMKLKVSNISQTSGYTNIPASGAVTPNTNVGPFLNTIYHYVLKRPTGSTSPGAPSYVAIYTPVASQLGTNNSTGFTNYYDAGDISAPGSSFINATPQVQVLATPLKLW